MPSLTLHLISLHISNYEGEDDYDIDIASFSAGSPASFDDPGDGGEVETGDITVKRHGSDRWEKVTETVLYEHYVQECDLKDDGEEIPQFRRKTAMQKAEEAITEKLFEYAHEYYAEQYNDSREGYYD